MLNNEYIKLNKVTVKVQYVISDCIIKFNIQFIHVEKHNLKKGKK